mgnify:CR=1 FL=1
MQNLINTTFAYCVRILEIVSSMLGITYKAANVYFFCIIEPVVFIIMLYIIIKQYIKIKTLKTNK